VLSLVLTDDDPLPHAEERRVFYVALTRARHRVYVCVPPSAPSVFAKELAHPDFAGMVSVDQKARPRLGGLGTA
jgi:DNA helicase-4